jgi:branched-chain amino acid transport system ATP-binding protein
MLEVKQLNVLRGKIQVLWDASIRVEKGEFVTLIGANGAGKTSLLSTVVGLLKPASGVIYFNGKEINNLPPYKIVDLGIAFIPEDRKLFAGMTVRENLILGAYSSRGKGSKEETLRQVYQLFPVLKNREKQVTATLSGGEQRMLAIARGLMSNPELLILDEPSQGLAPKVTLEVFEALRRLKEQGISILLAEQNVNQALKCADRAYVIETGKITLEGKGVELLNNEYIKEAFLGL